MFTNAPGTQDAGRSWHSPDHYNVDVLVPCLHARQAEAMYKINMEIQLLTQLNIETLVAGVAADERSEKSSLKADLIPLDGLQDVRRHVLDWMPTGITSMQFIKSARMHKSLISS